MCQGLGRSRFTQVPRIQSQSVLPVDSQLKLACVQNPSDGEHKVLVQDEVLQ
jgi:hypothetical protein